MRRWFVLVGITLIISACSALAGDSNSNTAQTAEQSSSEGEDAFVSWDRDALNVVFQADVVGGIGFGTFSDGNRVPLCTIYGDGRIVWVAGDNNQVVFDFLTDEQIIDFVTYLTVTERFFTFDAGLESLMPSPEMPITDVLLLQVNGVSHRTDSFGDWTDDYFNRILNNCMTLGQQPRIFQPSAGWLSIQFSAFSTAIPSIPWEAEAAAISLVDVGEMPSSSIWITNSLAASIWTTIRENGGQVQFNQDGVDYLAVFHVPGVTSASPPPPAEGETELVTEEPDTEG